MCRMLGNEFAISFLGLVHKNLYEAHKNLSAACLSAETGQAGKALGLTMAW